MWWKREGERKGVVGKRGCDGKGVITSYKHEVCTPYNICSNADKKGGQNSKWKRNVEYHVEDKWGHLWYVSSEHVGRRLLEIVEEEATYEA